MLLNRYQRFYSTKPIMLAMLLSMISLITALVAISGYFITCDELEYEAQRQIQQVLPLGIFIQVTFFKFKSSASANVALCYFYYKPGLT